MGLEINLSDLNFALSDIQWQQQQQESSAINQLDGDLVS